MQSRIQMIGGIGCLILSDPTSHDRSGFQPCYSEGAPKYRRSHAPLTEDMKRGAGKLLEWNPSWMQDTGERDASPEKNIDSIYLPHKFSRCSIHSPQALSWIFNFLLSIFPRAFLYWRHPPQVGNRCSICMKAFMYATENVLFGAEVLGRVRCMVRRDQCCQFSSFPTRCNESSSVEKYIK